MVNPKSRKRRGAAAPFSWQVIPLSAGSKSRKTEKEKLTGEVREGDGGVFLPPAD